MQTLKIGDVIATTSPEYHTLNLGYIPLGQVGTVVEVFSYEDGNIYEVLFTGSYKPTVKEKDLLKLQFN